MDGSPGPSTAAPAAPRPARRWHERVRTPPRAPDERHDGPAEVLDLEWNGLRWIHVEQAGADEATWLADEFGFEHSDLDDVIARRRQRPKVDDRGDYLFLVLRFPRFHKDVGRIRAAELHAFVRDGLVVTIPDEPLKPLIGLWSRCDAEDRVRQGLMTHGSGFLLHGIVDAMYEYCFPILDKIGFKLDSVEDRIFDGHNDALTREIFDVKQEIISFRKIFKPLGQTLGLVRATAQRYTDEPLAARFAETADKSERIWDTLENYKEVAESLESTNEALLAHRLNDIIKILTMLSAVMLPLSVIAGIYGMNVSFLPFAHHPYLSLAFPLFLMVLLAGGLLIWFKRQRWL